MHSALEHLSREAFARVVFYLPTRYLLMLWTTGGLSLRNLLSQAWTVNDFTAKVLRAVPDFATPPTSSILQRFPHLQSLDWTLGRIGNSQTLLRLNIGWLPSTLTRLVLSSPSCEKDLATSSFNFREVTPSLTYLSIHCAKAYFTDTFLLGDRLPTSLSTLILGHNDLMTARALSILPPHITHLGLYWYQVNDFVGTISPHLKSFKVFSPNFEHAPPHFACLPPNLEEFVSESMFIIQPDLSPLPSSLTRLHLGSVFLEPPFHLPLLTDLEASTLHRVDFGVFPRLKSLRLRFVSSFGNFLWTNLPPGLVDYSPPRPYQRRNSRVGGPSYSKQLIPSLPRGLRKLDLFSFPGIEAADLEHLPPSLTEILFKEATAPLMANIPASVTSIDTEKLEFNVETLSALPRNLQRLECAEILSCEELSLLQLPLTLKMLQLGKKSTMLYQLSNESAGLLPSLIQSLRVINCPGLNDTFLHNLAHMKDLRHLQLTHPNDGLFSLEAVVALPRSLQTLKIDHVKAWSKDFRDWPKRLPPTIETLSITWKSAPTINAFIAPAELKVMLPTSLTYHTIPAIPPNSVISFFQGKAKE